MTEIENFNPNQLISNERKQLAAYYTKKSISDLIVSLIITKKSSIIFDPSCGNGSLLKSYFEQIKQLNGIYSLNTLIVGIEIQESAFKEVNSYFKDKIREVNSQIFLGDTFTILKENKTKFSFLNFDSTQKFNSEFNVIIISNPPYTKKQRLQLEYRKTISNFINLDKTANIGLHFYYIKLINQILPIYGIFALILPLTISYAEHGSKIIKDFLLSNTIGYIIISEAETAFSIDSNLEEIILIGRKEKENPINDEITVIQLKKKIINKSWVKISSEIINKSNNSEFFSLKSVAKSDLLCRAGITGWNFLFRSKKMNSFLNNINTQLKCWADNSHYKMKRGINLPADFFFIPNKYYKITSNLEDSIILESKVNHNNDLDLKHKIELNKSYLKPIIRKPEYYKEKISLSKSLIEKNYVLNIKQENKILDQNIKDYIKFGYSIGANKRSNTIQYNDSWFYRSITRESYCSIILTFKWDPRYRTFLFNYSKDPVLAGQAFWGLFIGGDDERFQVAWLNSSINMALIYNIADVQRRIWRQLSGNRIKKLNVIPVKLLNQLSKDDKTNLLKYLDYKHDTNLINELSHALTSIEKQKFNLRVITDLIFLKLLMSNVNSYIDILKRFYQDFKEELIRLSSNLD